MNGAKEIEAEKVVSKTCQTKLYLTLCGTRSIPSVINKTMLHDGGVCPWLGACSLNNLLLLIKLQM